jgi:phosphohistidine phosphatase
MIYLVHHADAVPADEDTQRPLSLAGRAHVEQLATAASARGVRPIAIWHSGKLRARQTAEAFWRICNPLAELTAIRGLQPDDPPQWIRDRLQGETREIMLVGHMPGLGRIRSLLVHGAVADPATDFPQHGLVALEPADEGCVEKWQLQ